MSLRDTRRRVASDAVNVSRFPFLLALVCTALTARAASEPALLDLWKQHLATPDDHETTIKACRAFASANANDPLLPVVHDIEAWHDLRAGRDAEALRLMSIYVSAPPGPVTDGARRIALG